MENEIDLMDVAGSIFTSLSNRVIMMCGFVWRIQQLTGGLSLAIFRAFESVIYAKCAHFDYFTFHSVEALFQK